MLLVLFYMETLIGQGKTFDSFPGKSNLDILEYLDPTPAFEERICQGWRSRK